jgi:hypothetical protein
MKQRTTERILIVGGFFMGLICSVGLFLQGLFIWVVCPQALIVMFLRQMQHGYDSLGAAGIPDLLMGLFYGPAIGRILGHAIRKGNFRSVLGWVVIGHLVAIGLAVLLVVIRNRTWGVR